MQQLRLSTTTYGTWLPYQPIVMTRINSRQISLFISAPPQAQNRERYGSNAYKVYIQKPTGGYDDTIWFKAS